MTDFYVNFEIPEGFCSGTSSPVSDTGSSVIKGERCPKCGRDTSQPNLPPPSATRSSHIKKISPVAMAFAVNVAAWEQVY
jgi:hypothetical protein